MKEFSNHILTDSQIDTRIGLYQLGSHRARMGVMTGLTSIYLNTAEDLKRFIKSGNNIYIVMRQSDWNNKFFNLPMTIAATDTGWKKTHLSKAKIKLIFINGLSPYLQEYSEKYVLLKTQHK